MRRPIFLHSGYRSGSTWFWNCFRECPGTHAYYEPFNVKKATMTPETIAGHGPDSWPSGHPQLTRPYSMEYQPLLAPNGGVRRFDPRFALETYFKTDADEGIARYMAMLVEHAQSMDKTPVLGFCCSLGRVQWFRRFCDGWNIVTWRNPRDQWVSTHRQLTEHGISFFEIHYLLVAYLGSLYPELAPFFTGLGPIPSPAEISPDMPMFSHAAGIGDRFRFFLRVFALDTLLSVQHADMVVDLDHLNESAAYRDQITRQIRSESGLTELSFDDCRLPRHAFSDDADYRAILSQEQDFLAAFARTPMAGNFDTSLPFLRSRLARISSEG